jgi:(p)ppGpp synthase/HD superfamily hydrolase
MYARTNIQLYEQLRADDRSSSDLAVVHVAYRTASQLFAGRFQASGRDYLAHVVGVASILATLRLPIPIVAAGVVHNAYRTGDFGPARSGILDAQRQFLRRRVGDEVESYVSGFRAHPLNRRAIEVALAEPGRVSAIERMVLLIRLADVLEQLLDLGVLYRGNAEKWRARIRRDGSLMTDVARILGFPGLASELDRAFEETLSSELPPELVAPDGPSDGFVIVPRSYKRRWSLLRSLGAGLGARAGGSP